jgi:hypothetical protein
LLTVVAAIWHFAEVARAAAGSRAGLLFITAPLTICLASAAAYAWFGESTRRD